MDGRKFEEAVAMVGNYYFNRRGGNLTLQLVKGHVSISDVVFILAVLSITATLGLWGGGLRATGVGRRRVLPVLFARLRSSIALQRVLAARCP